jgi:hypothetical protein
MQKQNALIYLQEKTVKELEIDEILLLKKKATK